MADTNRDDVRHAFTVALLNTTIAVDLDDRSISAENAAVLAAPWGAALTEEPPQTRVWCSLNPQCPAPSAYSAFVRSSDLSNLAAQLCDVLSGEGLAGLIPDSVRTAGLTAMPDTVGIRAGAVALEAGAVLLVGRTHLDAELAALADRAGYLGDRAVGVDLRAGTVLAALTPVTSYPGGRVGSRRESAPAEVGLRPVAGPLPLHAIAVVEAAGEDGWEPLSVPATVARLAPAVPLFAALPHPVQDVAQLVGLVEGGVRLRYTDPTRLPDLLDEALHELSPQPMAIPVEPGAGDSVAPALGAVRRTPMLDGISDGATMTLCREDRTVVSLAGLGPLLWDVAREWTAPEDLVRQVVARVDAPGQSDQVAAAATAALDALVQEKVLTRLV